MDIFAETKGENDDQHEDKEPRKCVAGVRLPEP